jgi:tRNA threonylcarbamoyladenosine biosynthesis protein TsaB
VGVATANALAQALKIPLIGIPTLQVVAASTSLPPAASIIAASPSKRSELYLQHWTNVPPWESQSPIVPVLIAHLASHLEAYGFPFLVGESAQTWLVEAGSPPSVPLDIPPRASSLAKLALDSLLASDPSTLIPPPYLVPFYIRLSQPEEKSPT